MELQGGLHKEIQKESTFKMQNIINMFLCVCVSHSQY